jgi:hypothetical protein
MANTFTIACKTHGAIEPVLACTHIAIAQPGQHFSALFQVPADAENQIQAWCETCEAARIADQGWYDAADAIAKWSYICINCFHEKSENCDEMICYEGEETPVDKPV